MPWRACAWITTSSASQRPHGAVAVPARRGNGRRAPGGSTSTRTTGLMPAHAPGPGIAPLLERSRSMQQPRHALGDVLRDVQRTLESFTDVIERHSSRNDASCRRSAPAASSGCQGHLTLHDTDESRLLARLKAVLTRVPDVAT